MMRTNLCIVFLVFALSGKAQTFELRQVNDSLHHLVLTTGEEQDVWVLRYPVYRFCVADVNGDGVEEALVGVVKSTRFFKDKGRRLFIFKNYNGFRKNFLCISNNRFNISSSKTKRFK